ncbi:hypothetical protein CBR_g3662 [Chara braunii]|uniref:Uncharacterized protein n=1 Tax=Chara braunii TaxID=69332 RepID=A0A388KG61_CHABU|nr:hypothetical protein CBR_g3662 [Chara braunii]|eukprot:GBG68963.1 hypothetical protein CBR_g3662 [Chara braunii]
MYSASPAFLSVAAQYDFKRRLHFSAEPRHEESKETDHVAASDCCDEAELVSHGDTGGGGGGGGGGRGEDGVMYRMPMDVARAADLRSMREGMEEEERRTTIALEQLADDEWFTPFLFPWERPILSSKHHGQPIGPFTKAYWAIFGLVVAAGSAKSIIRGDQERFAANGSPTLIQKSSDFK